MHEIILFASGVCVIRGQLTAFVRVIGKVIDCHERINDHLENRPLTPLARLADFDEGCRAFIRP